MINEYKRFYLLYGLLCVSLISAYSQTISGLVQHKGEPVVAAQIIDLADKKAVAFTNTAGQFSFESKQVEFMVYAIGYESFNFKFTGNAVTINLVKNSQLLDQVVISENRRETAIKNATVSLEIIKPDLIGNTGSVSIDDVLTRLNGVQIVDNQPNIRSGSGWSYGAGSRVQVLVNDIPMLSGDAGQPLWTFIPTEGVKSMEIIKGASSVIYGSSALNGVINIKTKLPKAKPVSEVTISSGVYDLPKRASLDINGGKRSSVTNLSTFHSGMIKKVGYTLALNALDDNGYKMSDFDRRIRVSTGLRRRYDKNNVTVGVNATYQSGNSGSFLLWESLDQGYTALDSGITATNTSRLSVDPFVTFYGKKLKHHINTRYLNISNSVDNGDSLNDKSNFSNLVYGEYRASLINSFKGWQALGGVVGSYTKTESPIFNGNQSISNGAAYIQIEREWQKLVLTGGVRYEIYKLNDRVRNKPVLRTGLNYELAKYTFLRASYGQGYRFPSIAESFISTSVGPLVVYPNDSLEPESGSNLEIGLKQGFKLAGVSCMFDVAAFQMSFQDMMEFTFGQWGPFVNLSNTGAGFKTLNTTNTRIRGFESSVFFEKETKNIEIQGFIGYTYSKAISLEPDKVFALDFQNTPQSYSSTSYNDTLNILKYRPQHLLKSDVMVTFKKISLAGGIAFQSQMLNADKAFFEFPISLFVPGIEDAYNQRLTRHFIGNVRLGYAITDKLKASLIISNISNLEYAYRPADIAAPRSFRFQIAYNLK